MFPPVESQVIFLSKETAIVSVGLRTAEVSYTNQNKTAWKLSSIQITLKFLTFRQSICPLSLFLKEIPFASFTNAIDLKIERVLTGFLIDMYNA
jgi:hypothetical protein